MTPELLLFLLRLAAAGLLLAFLGLLIWFLYQDVRAAERAGGVMTAGGLGVLRVLANTHEAPAIDSTIELSPVTSIGRHSGNSIVLDDTYVSGEHALLSWRDSQWWLEDLGSRNGTLLNDAPLTEAVVVSAGDVITIGGVRLKLETATLAV
jgi:pSer/pThr/pTyr-binding forkhead associated (FHA) protein